MGLYEVLLGVDRAARDTGRRIHMRVRESDPLSAAITAEREADGELDDCATMYTHAIRVRPVRRRAQVQRVPRTHRPVALAA